LGGDKIHVTHCVRISYKTRPRGATKAAAGVDLTPAAADKTAICWKKWAELQNFQRFLGKSRLHFRGECF
jgi:hypothetical protein